MDFEPKNITFFTHNMFKVQVVFFLLLCNDP